MLIEDVDMKPSHAAITPITLPVTLQGKEVPTDGTDAIDGVVDAVGEIVGEIIKP